MSKRIVLFNHKGGVSKTTSVYNIGWMLSKNHRVLVVDADPQCNLSNLILGDDFEKYYIDQETRQHNIKDGVSAAFDGRPSPIQAVNCFSPSRANSLYLLAGHADLSAYDTALSFASINAMPTLQNLPGAFAQLMRLTEEKYDIEYTLIDLNPGLSAINQNLFLAAHGFVVPTNPDPFSVMAIDTLKNVLPRWVEWKKNSIENFSDSAYPLLEGVPKFLGTLIQRFNIRNGVATKPYIDNISEIKNKVSGEFFLAMSKAGMALNEDQYSSQLISNGYCLDEIPDFQGLLPKSRFAGVPIFELTNAEISEAGKVLTTMSETRDGFSERFRHLGEELIKLLHYA